MPLTSRQRGTKESGSMPETDLRLIEVSLVPFRHEDVCKVADRLGMTTTEVYDQLREPAHDKAIDRAFHYITGMHPIRNLSPLPSPWWERLDFISEPPGT